MKKYPSHFIVRLVMVSSPRMIIWKVKERATVGHSLPRRFKLLEELEKWLVPGAPLCWLQEYSPLPLFKSTCSPVTMSTEQSFKMNLECNSKNPFIAQLYRHFNYNFSNAKHAQFIPSALVTSASRKSFHLQVHHQGVPQEVQISALFTHSLLTLIKDI